MAVASSSLSLIIRTFFSLTIFCFYFYILVSNSLSHPHSALALTLRNKYSYILALTAPVDLIALSPSLVLCAPTLSLSQLSSCSVSLAHSLTPYHALVLPLVASPPRLMFLALVRSHSYALCLTLSSTLTPSVSLPLSTSPFKTVLVPPPLFYISRSRLLPLPRFRLPHPSQRSAPLTKICRFLEYGG